MARQAPRCAATVLLLLAIVLEPHKAMSTRLEGIEVRNQIASTAKGYRRSLTQDGQPFTPLSSPGAVVISPAVPAVNTFTSAESNPDVAVHDGAAATAAAAALAGIPTAAKTTVGVGEQTGLAAAATIGAMGQQAPQVHQAVVHEDTHTHGVKVAHKPHSIYVIIHSVLMAVAFGLVIPAGMLMSRYGKHWGQWFNLHRATQVVGSAIAAAGFFLGLALHKLKHMEAARLHQGHGRRLQHDAHSSGHHSAAWLHRHKVYLSHKYLAIAIFIVLTLQIAAAIVRRPAKGSPFRAAWVWSHWIAGWGSLAAGLANCSTGLYLLQPLSAWWIALTTAVIAGIIGTVALMEIRRYLFGPVLEGYRQSDRDGVELVGGNPEERQGLKTDELKGKYSLNGDEVDSYEDDDEELAMVTAKHVPPL